MCLLVDEGPREGESDGMSGSILTVCLKLFCLQISSSSHQMSSWGGSSSNDDVLKVQYSKLKWQLHSFPGCFHSPSPQL